MAGVSDTENKDLAKKWIDDLDPKSVLDIGAGQGTYSMLARQDHQEWSALEVFYPYVSEFELWTKYDHIFIGDARYMDYHKIMESKHGWELIIAADMLEHMNKDQAKRLIGELIVHSGHLLICFPVEHQEQHAGEEGNDFEDHVDHWEFDEMRHFLNALQGPESVIDFAVGNVLAYFLVRGQQ